MIEIDWETKRRSVGSQKWAKRIANLASNRMSSWLERFMMFSLLLNPLASKRARKKNF
jgi:hypothetical protein